MRTVEDPVDAARRLAWSPTRCRDADHGWSGFGVGGWADSLCLLHNMCERLCMPPVAHQQSLCDPQCDVGGCRAGEASSSSAPSRISTSTESSDSASRAEWLSLAMSALHIPQARWEHRGSSTDTDRYPWKVFKPVADWHF